MFMRLISTFTIAVNDSSCDSIVCMYLLDVAWIMDCTQFVLFRRDVSGVELLMNNHQSLRAEIDARDENFAICINLGKDILARGHYRSSEVRVKLTELQSKRGDMMQQWDDKWDYLQISESSFPSCLAPSVW